VLVVGKERVGRKIEHYAIQKVQDVGEGKEGEREVHRSWVDRVTCWMNQL